MRFTAKIACTQTLFSFPFRSFRKHRRARAILLPPPLPPYAGGQ